MSGNFQDSIGTLKSRFGNIMYGQSQPETEVRKVQGECLKAATGDVHVEDSVRCVIERLSNLTTMAISSKTKPPTRALAKRGRPRSMESEQAILDATVKIVRKEGYAGLTIDKIAVLAKASSATIYRRWPTKEHLLLAVLDQHTPLIPVDRGNLLDELLDMFASKSKRTTDADPMRQAIPMLLAEAAFSPELRTSMNTFNDKRRMPMRVMLARAISRRELPKETNIELAIDIIHGSTYMRASVLDQGLSLEWMDSMFRILIRGLGGKIK